jgi:hypothetical protein
MLFLSLYILFMSGSSACLVFAPKPDANGECVVDMRPASWGMKVGNRVVIFLSVLLLAIVLGNRAYDPLPSKFAAIAQALSVLGVFAGLLMYMVVTGIREETQTALFEAVSNDGIPNDGIPDDMHVPLLVNESPSVPGDGDNGDNVTTINDLTNAGRLPLDQHVGPPSDLVESQGGTGDDISYLHLRNEENNDEEEAHELTKVVESITLGEALLSLEFHLHFVAQMIGCGCGLVLINNLGQLTSVVGLPDGDQQVLISLQSVFNCLGRLLGGWLSDIALSQYGFTRPSSLAVTMGIMFIAMLALLLATPVGLFIGTVLVGLSFGSLFALSPVLAGEHFGVKYLGAIYTSFGPGVSMGSFVLASFLFAGVYDANTPAGEDNCQGPDCVRMTFGICALLCLVATFLCVWLSRRTRPRYIALYPHYSALRS